MHCMYRLMYIIHQPTALLADFFLKIQTSSHITCGSFGRSVSGSMNTKQCNAMSFLMKAIWLVVEPPRLKKI